MALQLTTNDSYQEGDNRRFIDLLIEIERDLHVLAELRGIAGTQATKYEAGATYETCPVCQEPNVKVEHALEGQTNRPVHLWYCGQCGESLAYVGYDCEHCPEANATPLRVLPGVAGAEE